MGPPLAPAGDDGNGAAWLLAFVFGFSRAFWSEAADPGCYAFAALAAVLWMATLVHDRPISPGRQGALHGFFGLWHQMLILLVPAYFIRRPWKDSLRYLVAAGLVYGAAYSWAAWTFHGPSLKDAAFWAFGPGGPAPGMKIFSSAWWSVDLGLNARVFIDALGNAFVSTDGAPVYMSWLLNILLICGLVAMIMHRLYDRAIGAVAILCVFQFFFYIGALRYRILVMPFMAVLVSSVIVFIRSWFGWVILWVFVLGMGWVNYSGPIRARMQPTTNAERTQWLKSRIPERAVFFFEGTSERSMDNVYLAYFAPEIRARSLKGYRFENPDGDLTLLRNGLLAEHRAGARVVIEQPLIDLFPGWTVQGSELGPNGYGLFQITPDLKAK